MIAFYQNLKKGMTEGEALRQAKLTLIDKHPLYWSPFILIGDARYEDAIALFSLQSDRTLGTIQLFAL